MKPIPGRTMDEAEKPKSENPEFTTPIGDWSSTPRVNSPDQGRLYEAAAERNLPDWMPDEDSPSVIEPDIYLHLEHSALPDDGDFWKLLPVAIHTDAEKRGYDTHQFPGDGVGSEPGPVHELFEGIADRMKRRADEPYDWPADEC